MKAMRNHDKVLAVFLAIQMVLQLIAAAALAVLLLYRRRSKKAADR